MLNNSFPREVRLLTSREYDAVFKNPVRASAPGVLILGRKNDGDKARLGLVVPKKVLKRAVWRNRVKRVARETFRNSQGDLPCADFVFIARPGIGQISNQELSSQLQRLCKAIARRLLKQQQS